MNGRKTCISERQNAQENSDVPGGALGWVLGNGGVFAPGAMPLFTTDAPGEFSIDVTVGAFTTLVIFTVHLLQFLITGSVTWATLKAALLERGESLCPLRRSSMIILQLRAKCCLNGSWKSNLQSMVL